ncbi:EF1B-like protein [Mya arenaria]|uniref:EF1B-like protein n=1 Tax=Mya arenaria TaxID=6604 RepID=A0ABY7ELJ9_MYAAR|nr:EF1B-like protein [Mya arenaria]
MGFGDLKNKTGLKALDDYLADKSYIEGFQPSQADAVVFKGLSGAPAAEFVNALRWYNQINSYGGAKDSFPGVAKALTQYGPAGGDAQAAKKDDDDFDLFEPALIAKSSILLDVKPWDDETDMKALEEKVRSVQTEGLVWGAVGYGIKKLQINCVVEDDKVGTDFLEEEICAFEDFVQSVDVAAFNKI